METVFYRYLSFDLGASSGRAIVVTKEGKNLSFDEIYRFRNEMIEEDGVLSWNFAKIWENIQKSLQLAFAKYPKIRSVGIDTWGVDYGYIGYDGNLLKNPASYRDSRTRNKEAELLQIVDRKSLYRKTGIQHLPFNTVYQLAYDAIYRRELLEKSETILMMPDLIAYYLTKEKRVEVTNLSTTSLYDPRKKEIISTMDYNIPKRLFPKIIFPGEVYGNITSDLAKKLNIPAVPVVAVCSHDTASAILSIPNKKKQLYISSGTWSLVGTLLDEPLTKPMAEENSYTNEVGYGGKIRFLKNIMGLWIVNQCKEQWEKEGKRYNYRQMDEKILSSRPFVSFIDPDDSLFAAPGTMTERIKEYCQSTYQPIPADEGEILRTIYQSFAFKYRYQIEKLEALLNTVFTSIVVVGGGSQIDLLNQMTASLCKKTVIIGAKEATVFGNALVLMMQDQAITNLEEGYDLMKSFYGVKRFKPLSADEYDKDYQRFVAVIEKGKLLCH